MLWTCCGLGRKKRKEQEQPDEQTPLLDPNILPFVPAPAPKVIDDEALLEYQRRLDRIIEEAAEKIVSVTSASTPPLSKVRSNTSGSSASNSNLQTTHSLPATPHQELPEPGSSHDVYNNDTLWRAEKPLDGSVYSMKKVPKKQQQQQSEGTRKSRKSKAKEHEQKTQKGRTSSEDDLSEEDQFGTVASYRTADAGDHEGDEDDLDSGDETPTGQTEHSSRKSKRRLDQRRPVQDIWDQSPRKGKALKQKQNKRKELDRVLAMSHAEFANLLTHD